MKSDMSRKKPLKPYLHTKTHFLALVQVGFYEIEEWMCCIMIKTSWKD